MIEAILLGVAQDGGVPQAGCKCPTCNAAWVDPDRQQWPACLGLVDHTTRCYWLLDATPSFPAQLHLLDTRLRETGPEERSATTAFKLAGILLTHAHIGHYSGLIHLGREVMHTSQLPVYATAQMAAFLQDHAPWSGLIKDGNIDLVVLEPGHDLALSPYLQIQPVAVHHRQDYSDTVAYLIQGPRRRLFYCPDIDAWGDREVQLIDALGLRSKGRSDQPRPAVSTPRANQPRDILLLDGTFFSADELPGRDLTQIPHPCVRDTVTICAAHGLHPDPAGATAPIISFIHLNHSNPLWQEGPALAWLIERGYNIGTCGQRWNL